MKTTSKARFFVVIHTVTPQVFGLDHALQETAVARENGADGIFIIPDYAKGTKLKATIEDQLLYGKVLREKFPDILIGINFLTPLLRAVPSIYGIQPNLIQTDGSSLEGIQKENLPITEFFCGLAFKYSPKENLTGDKLREHCQAVANICDVPTTSGSATCHAADIAKITAIRSHLPKSKRLGLASGVTAENVMSYLRAGVTDFLVATSLIDHVDAR